MNKLNVNDEVGNTYILNFRKMNPIYEFPTAETAEVPGKQSNVS